MHIFPPQNIPGAVMWGHAYTRKRHARDGRRATEDLGTVTVQAGAPAEDMDVITKHAGQEEMASS